MLLLIYSVTQSDTRLLITRLLARSHTHSLTHSLQFINHSLTNSHNQSHNHTFVLYHIHSLTTTDYSRFYGCRRRSRRPSFGYASPRVDAL